tara:strand:+ start:288 stop:623 length:336 start_codon:yes stop_codon:yes gene_type:complete
MEDLKLSGVITKKLPVVKGTSTKGEWSKQDFVIETAGTYPKEVAITTFGEKTELLDAVNVGDTVDVSINLASREYDGKYYTNVNAWAIVPKIGTVASADPLAANAPDGLPF